MKRKEERPWPLQPEGNAVTIEEISLDEFAKWRDTNIIVRNKDFGENMPKGIVKATGPDYKGNARVGDTVVYRGGQDGIMYNKKMNYRIFQMDIIFILGQEALDEENSTKIVMEANMNGTPALHDDRGNAPSNTDKKR